MTVSVFVICAHHACAQTLSGLQAWWNFDQDGGSVVPDASGHGNQGLLRGNFGRRRGVQGAALEFRGRDYMDGTSLPGLSTQQMTLAAFLRVDHAGDEMWIASKGRMSESFWGIQVLGNGKLSFSATWRDNPTGQGQWESTQSVTPNQWTHIAVSFDGARIVFYIDGRANPVDAQFIYNQGTVKDEALLLGANDSADDAYFDGLMDEVRLYNRALSQNEIRGLIVSSSLAEQPIPGDGAQSVKTPLLHWQASPSAVRQRVFFGIDQDHLDCVADSVVPPELNSSYLHEGGIRSSQTYFWRIDSIDAAARVSSGDLWSFTTLGLRAENPEPSHGAHSLPLELGLMWTPGLNSSQYNHLYFGTDRQAVENADESWPQFQGRISVFDPLFDLDTLESGTTYFWRVDGSGFDPQYKGDVWHFSTQSATSSLDPDLNLWWKLDEGSGDMAQDASGMSRHGQIRHGNWVEGRWGEGIEFDSRSSRIAISEAAIEPSDDLTVSVWVYPHSQTHERVIAWWDARGVWLTDDRVVVTWDGQHRSVIIGDITEEWTHVALTARGNLQRVAYINGDQRPLIPGAIRFPSSVNQSGFSLGNTGPGAGGHFFDGIMDDVRVYTRALGAQEVFDLFAGDALQASHPSPAHAEEIDPDRVKQLSWQYDPLARGYDVYLGEDRQAVETAVPSSADVYLGPHTLARVDLPQGLRHGHRYYWRVDHQGNAAITQGQIWQFMTDRIEMIDDFEAYSAAPSERIFETWIDGQGPPDVSVPGNGTGSYVGHDPPPHYETELTHGGDQSMPFYYDNTGNPPLSEINRSFSTVQDWMSNGMKSLVLYYWGDPANALGVQDRLYLAVRDDQGREAVVVCDHRATLLQRPRWHQWKIAWSQFDQGGINLRAIAHLSIGVGRRARPQAGEAGVILIDDLGLSSLGLAGD